MNQKIVENPKQEDHPEIKLSSVENYSERINLNSNVEVSVNVENWYISVKDKKTGREVFIRPWAQNEQTLERVCSISVIQNTKTDDPKELDYLEVSTEV